MRELFRFPNPVNETSARVVAFGVVVEAALFVTFRQWWLLIPLVFGFAARVATGPTLSPLGQLATRVISPAISAHPRLVPGPPKRFAQSIGLAFTTAAAVAWWAGLGTWSVALMIGLIGAASLEAFAGICVGCLVYARLWGCADCDDITRRSSVDGGDPLTVGSRHLVLTVDAEQPR